MTNDIDCTVLVGRPVPRSWDCPHCNKRNRTADESNEILMRYSRFLQPCGHCGYMHKWELTDPF